ncbi:hypothetical protein CANARDRAFT_186522, partial [[Candida] arabinofermentans NRRL YB-2248]
PLRQRLQTFALFLHTSSVILLPFLYFFLWCFPIFWPFLLIYTFGFYLNDRSPSNGNAPARFSPWLRNCSIFEYFSTYFPVTLHKTADLKPTFVTAEVEAQDYAIHPILRTILPSILLKLLESFRLVSKTTIIKKKQVRQGPRYIFGYHPHGIIAMGVTAGFTMECAGFSKMFPGITTFVTTLVNQFHLPFYRDYLMALGITAVTRKNLRALINQDMSVVIVVGGASESLLAKPGLNSIVLKKRKGFVKLALEMVDDICLVPVYAFGENNIYDVYYTNDGDGPPLSQTRKNDGYIKRVLKGGQLWLKKNAGFTLPIIMSRGIFNYDFGLLPYRRPIDVVFGSPISVKRLNGHSPGDPVSEDEINHYHTLYVNALQTLFDDHKAQF